LVEGKFGLKRYLYFELLLNKYAIKCFNPLPTLFTSLSLRCTQEILLSHILRFALTSNRKRRIQRAAFRATRKKFRLSIQLLINFGLGIFQGVMSEI